jgi:hypothetical protein
MVREIGPIVVAGVTVHAMIDKASKPDLRLALEVAG